MAPRAAKPLAHVGRIGSRGGHESDTRVARAGWPGGLGGKPLEVLFSLLSSSYKDCWRIGRSGGFAEGAAGSILARATFFSILWANLVLVSSPLWESR